jgi:large-conductance mechanosensitive channel
VDIQTRVFLSTLITFLMVCIVVFLMAKAAKRWGLE